MIFHEWAHYVAPDLQTFQLAFCFIIFLFLLDELYIIKCFMMLNLVKTLHFAEA